MSKGETYIMEDFAGHRVEVGYENLPPSAQQFLNDLDTVVAVVRSTQESRLNPYHTHAPGHPRPGGTVAAGRNGWQPAPFDRDAAIKDTQMVIFRAALDLHPELDPKSPEALDLKRLCGKVAENATPPPNLVFIRLTNGPHEIVVEKGGFVTGRQARRVSNIADELQAEHPVPDRLRLTITDEMSAYGETYAGSGSIRLHADLVTTKASTMLRYTNREGAPTHYMPMAAQTDPLRYCMFHEWGHTQRKLSEIPEGLEKLPGLSKYGKQNKDEAFAEGWTEWHLSEGRTKNRAARTMAKLFGWAVPS